MKRPVRVLVASVLLALTLPASADPGPALRPELWLSSDSDGNDTQRYALGWDVRRDDIEHWWGFEAERARYSGPGWSDRQERLSVRAAGGSGNWRWQGEAGTNGDDLLGSFAVHSQDAWRKEFFLERDVLETRDGVAQGLVHTFAGAALDVPLSERWSASGLVGLQDFGGGNLRRHLRANLVYAVLPGQGLSAQLRLRQFNDSDPGEGDYFAPGRYRQALGVVSLRRFHGGHQYRVTAGLGRQQSADAGWEPARLLELEYQTPQNRGRYLRATAGYSDVPAYAGTPGEGYRYRYVRLEGVWQF